VANQDCAIYPKLIHQGKDVVSIVFDPLAADAIGAAMCREVDSVHTLIVQPPDLWGPG
jgi:hypothetical protein